MPVNVITVGDPAPLLVMLTLPLALPLLDGAKVTLKLVLVFAATTSGVDRPLALKPGPLVLTEEIVTLDPPELLRFTVWVLLWPVVTLPKAMLDGLATSCPAVSPIPAKATV